MKNLQQLQKQQIFLAVMTKENQGKHETWKELIPNAT